jgi:MFS family permease
VPDDGAPSAWAPLRRALFRDRWIASLVSNFGAWMQDTAGTWLMATLTTSPLLIALMQTAASLPVLLLGLPAGAMADVFDRRRLLIFWQSWMLAAALLLSILTFAGLIGPGLLLALTFLLALGAALNNPAWQAIVPELVPRSELPDAIALNSAGFNLARAAGPALGGLTVAAFASARRGAGVVFLINALSFGAVILVLYFWRRQPWHTSALPAERFIGSMRAGVRYARHSPPVRSVLARTVALTSCLSAMWALLAVVAQQDLHQGAVGYGFLNGCIGAGAVAGATTLPLLRRRHGADFLINGAALVFTGTLLVLAWVRSVPLVLVALFAGGMAWTTIASSLNIVLQTSTAPWVQARALGTYQMVFQGGMALGSAFWGWVAEHTSTPLALTASAIALLAGLPLHRRFPLTRPASDFTPAGNDFTAASEGYPLVGPEPDDGPVLVTVEYRIDPGQADAFLRAVHALRPVRLRDGALLWGLFRDTEEPAVYLESFLVESWVEHQRQHERFTVADEALRAAVLAFHVEDKPPVIRHLVYRGDEPWP